MSSVFCKCHRCTECWHVALLIWRKGETHSTRKHPTLWWLFLAIRVPALLPAAPVHITRSHSSTPLPILRSRPAPPLSQRRQKPKGELAQVLAPSQCTSSTPASFPSPPVSASCPGLPSPSHPVSFLSLTFHLPLTTDIYFPVSNLLKSYQLKNRNLRPAALSLHSLLLPGPSALEKLSVFAASISSLRSLLLLL